MGTRAEYIARLKAEAAQRDLQALARAREFGGDLTPTDVRGGFVKRASIKRLAKQGHLIPVGGGRYTVADHAGLANQS